MSSIDSSITNLVASQRSAIRTEISYTVAAKQLDALEQQGEAAVELLESAVQLSKAPGKGGHVNARA